jgi:hypothetical protein
MDLIGICVNDFAPRNPFLVINSTASRERTLLVVWSIVTIKERWYCSWAKKPLVQSTPPAGLNVGDAVADNSALAS